MKNKTCSKCKLYKLVVEFTEDKSKKSGLRSYCKDCANLKSYTWRRENLDRSTKSKSKWAKENPDKHKDSQLRHTYGIGLEHFNKLFNDQEGKCLGCKKHQSELKKTLHVDHCHETGKVRGLLCHNCNTVLGHAYDNQEILINLSNYLKKYQ